MKLLTAVNNILPHLGENPVTSVDVRHPTVSLILDAIEEAKLNMLTQGWWFNTRDITLYPSSENEIFAPTNVLTFYCTDGQLIDIRGDKMYDLQNGTYTITKKVVGTIMDDLTFEELPTYAALAVQYNAAHSVYTKDFGIEQTVRYLLEQEKNALMMLMQEELRKKKYNSLKSSTAFRFVKARHR